MVTADQVRAMLRGDELGDFEEAGRRLDVPAGRAYLIATGRPADGSTPAGGLGSRAQALVNPREVNPTSRGDVHAWMRRLAQGDRSMRAGAAADDQPEVPG
jgi:hypothetical protein